MTTAAIEYEKLVAICTANESIATGQMFGKLCLKINSKAFTALHKETLVFKLSGVDHENALKLSGSTLWDPSGKGRPMKEWVAVPASEAKNFKKLLHAALSYVSET